MNAYDRLRRAGVRQHDIRSYALIGFDMDRNEAWERCHFIEAMGVKALPMWYHPLNALKRRSAGMTTSAGESCSSSTSTRRR